MIASGEKQEEYRDIKPFYCRRLSDYCKYMNFNQSNTMFGWSPTPHCKDGSLCFGYNGVYVKNYDAIRFHRGQGGKQTMLIECKGISVGYGNPEWGAPADKEVFIIKLGNRYITQLPTSYENKTTLPIAARSRKTL